jgi:thiamine-phosphate pyrophosphorylase
MPILLLVTDRRLYPAGRMAATIQAAAAAGVNLIQVRERDLPDRALVELTRAVVRAAGPGARVVVNDRVDVALAAGAAGVHLRADSVAAARVRAIVPPGFIVGRSVHREDEAVRVEREGGCDYLLFGTVFPSPSKPAGHSAVGVSALARICGAVRLPVVAIGGIGETNAAQVAAAGAAGVAAISLFAGSGDLGRTVAALRRPFDTPSSVA